jgi:hypothetical protein
MPFQDLQDLTLVAGRQEMGDMMDVMRDVIGMRVGTGAGALRMLLDVKGRGYHEHERDSLICGGRIDDCRASRRLVEIQLHVN